LEGPHAAVTTRWLEAGHETRTRLRGVRNHDDLLIVRRGGAFFQLELPARGRDGRPWHRISPRADDGTRIRNLLLTKQVRCQLRHVGLSGPGRIRTYAHLLVRQPPSRLATGPCSHGFAPRSRHREPGLMTPLGFEPRSYGVRARLSAVELERLESRMRDSNPPSPPWQGGV
jgi:hypothetical protein